MSTKYPVPTKEGLYQSGGQVWELDDEGTWGEIPGDGAEFGDHPFIRLMPEPEMNFDGYNGIFHDATLGQVFTDVSREMQVARDAGWTQEHDDREGWQHLVNEATYRLATFSELHPTDVEIDHVLTVAIGLLVNAKLIRARAAESGHTVQI